MATTKLKTQLFIFTALIGCTNIWAQNDSAVAPKFYPSFELRIGMDIPIRNKYPSDVYVNYSNGLMPVSIISELPFNHSDYGFFSRLGFCSSSFNMRAVPGLPDGAFGPPPPGSLFTASGNFDRFDMLGGYYVSTQGEHVFLEFHAALGAIILSNPSTEYDNNTCDISGHYEYISSLLASTNTAVAFNTGASAKYRFNNHFEFNFSVDYTYARAENAFTITYQNALLSNPGPSIISQGREVSDMHTNLICVSLGLAYCIH